MRVLSCGFCLGLRPPSPIHNSVPCCSLPNPVTKNKEGVRSLPGAFRESSLTSNPQEPSYWQLNHTCWRQLAAGTTNGPRWEADRKGVKTGLVVHSSSPHGYGWRFGRGGALFSQACLHTCSDINTRPCTLATDQVKWKHMQHICCWSCQVNVPVRFGSVPSLCHSLTLPKGRRSAPLAFLRIQIICRPESLRWTRNASHCLGPNCIHTWCIALPSNMASNKAHETFWLLLRNTTPEDQKWFEI